MRRAIDGALKPGPRRPPSPCPSSTATGARLLRGRRHPDVYATGRRGDFDHGRRFWADEYGSTPSSPRYGKPYVALMQGFFMGGGVGVAATAPTASSTRPPRSRCRCIGLMPDVGASHLWRAPGPARRIHRRHRARMKPGDAIHAGFADHCVPEARWPELAAALAETGMPA